METRYVAEFKIDQITGQRDGDKKKDANSVVKKERTFDSKTIGKGVATGVAVAMVTSNIYAKMQSTSNTITGNAVAQRSLDNKMAYLNEGLGLVGTLGVGAIIGGPVGFATAAGGLTVKYAMQGFNLSQENAIKSAQWQIESIVNAEKSNRLVKDITGIRI